MDGSFNCHKPMWDDASHHYLFTGPNLQCSATLINLLTKYDMCMALARGIATLEASNTKNHICQDHDGSLVLHLLQITILTAIEVTFPMSKPSPHAKHQWSLELNAKNQALKKLARKTKKHHKLDHPIHKEYCRVRNKFLELQKSTTEEHWKEYLESVDKGHIWDIHNFLIDIPAD
ncbi:uncharacterized protein EDB91DRAFT_1250581 [Suillus paluster]|uniref:uncharacterized protein n=1 Tax=Suillus paluster TaxID=48578 RepID=UPI001B861DB6|nr:uncharacterized protein EDB91DRAFT_1250581 [Suillus paluster]KAG1735064.1 hypothetical protein EDB91DRAFT_1250581 [Suillus paluster]